MPRNLYLLRHGQSEGNLVRRQFESTGDNSLYSEDFLNIHESQYNLTPEGVRQAKLAGNWLKENGLTYFNRKLVSNNTRAMQTAAHLNLHGADWMIDFNLRERDGGLFNAISPEQRDLDYIDQQKFYDTQSFFYRPPQGESVADVAQRVKIVLDTLARECDGKDVLIVCHGHVMRTFRIVLERMRLSQINDYLSTKEDWARVPNCAIVQYTRQNPWNSQQVLADHFDWVRIIRPAGGGELADRFTEIRRKKFSNQGLLQEAAKNRNLKKG